MASGIIRRTRSKDFVVFSDSLSSLQAIDSRKTENTLVLTILKEYTHLTNGGKSVTFCWIPSHVGIRGNENADTADFDQLCRTSRGSSSCHRISRESLFCSTASLCLCRGGDSDRNILALGNRGRTDRWSVWKAREL